MKYKGLHFEHKKNYLKKLTSDRAQQVFREEHASLLTGQPQIETPYSGMPQSLRVSTFAGLEPVQQEVPGQFTDVAVGSKLIQPIEGRDVGLINPSKISNRFKGLLQMIRDRIIDPLDEVLVKVHDYLISIPEKMYDAELKLREIFPLVLKGIIPTALMLLVFVNKAYGADGTSGDDVSIMTHFTNTLETVFDFATNHWKAIGLVAGNLWAVSSLFLGKLPDYALGRVGSFFANFGRHIIFPLAMMGNLFFLGSNLATTEYLNVRELFDNIGFAKLLWPSAGILSFFLGKTAFDYFKTRPNLDLDPHGTRLNHILTHLVYNFAMGTKTNYLVYRLLMTILGTGILLAALMGLAAAPSPPTFYIFSISLINLFFALWLLKSDLHMGIHSLVFMHQQKYSLIGERNPIISDRFMRMISGVFGPNTMVQKPHFNPKEAAFAGFYTMMINEYSENFELESETDIQPYGGQGNKTEIIAGYEVEGWKRDTQGCLRDFALVHYNRLQAILNNPNASNEEKRQAYLALIEVYDILADIYGDEGVDVADWRYRNRLDPDLPAARALQDRLFAQAQGRVTLFGLLEPHIVRDAQRKKDKKPTWFYDGDRLVDARFRNAVRKRLYRQAIKFRRQAAKLRKRIDEAQTQGDYSKLSTREATTLFVEILSRYSKKGNYVARKEDKNDDKKAAKITNVAFCQTHAGDTLYRVFVYDPKRKYFYVEYVPSLFIRIPNPKYNYGIKNPDGSVEPQYLWVDRTQLRDYLKFSHSGSNEIEYIDNSPPENASSRDLYIRVGWRRRKVKAYNLGDIETPNPGSRLVLREGQEHSLEESKVWIAGNTDSQGLEDMIVVDEQQLKDKFNVPEGKISWFRKRPEVVSFIAPYSYLMNDSEHVDMATPTTSGAFLEKDSRVNKVMRMMFAFKRKKMHFDDPEPDRPVEEVKAITWVKSDLAFVFYEEIGTEADLAGGRIQFRKGDVKQDGKVYRMREVPYDVMREGFKQIGLFGPMYGNTGNKKLILDSKKVHHMEARIENGKYVLYIHFKGKKDPVKVDMYGNTYARFLPHPDKILKMRREEGGATVEFLGFSERIGVTSYLCVDYGEGYKNDSDRYRFVRMPGRLKEFSSERIERVWKSGNQIFLDSSVQRAKILPWDNKWANAGQEGDDKLRVVGFNNNGDVWYGYDSVEKVYRWAPTKEEASLMGLTKIKKAKGKDLIKVKFRKAVGTNAEGEIQYVEKETVMPAGKKFGKPKEIAEIQAEGDMLQGVKIERQFLFGLEHEEVLPEEIQDNFEFIRFIRFREDYYGYDENNTRVRVASEEEGVRRNLKNIKIGRTVEVHFYKEGREWESLVDGNLFVGFNGIKLPQLNEIYQFNNQRTRQESLKPEIDDETQEATGNQVINEDFEFTLHPQLFTYEGVVYIRFHTCTRSKKSQMPEELITLLSDRDVHVVDINYSIAESAVKVEDRCTGRIEWVPSVARIEDTDISHIPETKTVNIGYFDHDDTYNEGGDLLYDVGGHTYNLDLQSIGVPKNARNIRVVGKEVVFEAFVPDVKGKLETRKVKLPDIVRQGVNIRIDNQFTDAKRRKYARVQVPKDARNVRIERGQLIYETGEGILVYRTREGSEYTLDLTYRGLPSSARNLRISDDRKQIEYEIVEKEGVVRRGTISVKALNLPEGSVLAGVRDYSREVSTSLGDIGISNDAFVHRTFLKEISHGYIPMEAENIQILPGTGMVSFTVNGNRESIPLENFGISNTGFIQPDFFDRAIRRQVQRTIGIDTPFVIADLQIEDGKITYKLIFNSKDVSQMDSMDKIEAMYGKGNPKWLKAVESIDGKTSYSCEESLAEDWQLNRDASVTINFIGRHFQLREPRGKRRVAISIPIPVDAYDFKIVDGVITYKRSDGETYEIGDAASGNDFIPWEEAGGSSVYQLKIAEHKESDIIHGYYSSTTGPQNTIGGDEQSNYDQRPFYTHDPSSGEAELDFFAFNEYYLDTPGGIIQIGKSGGQDKYGQPTSVTVNNGTPFFMKWSTVLEVGEVELPLLEFPYKKKIVLFGTEMGEASIIEDFQQAHYTLMEWRRQNKFIPKPSSLAENQGGAGVVSKMAIQRQRWGGSKEIGVDYILPDVVEEVWRGKILGSIPWIRNIWGQPSTMTWKEVIDHLMLITWYFVGPGELGRQLSPAVTLLTNGEIKPYIADFEYFSATVALDVLGGMGGYAFSMFKGGYRPFYSLVKGPGRFSALLPAYYELFDMRYQGSAIGPFAVTATTYEGVKRSHKRMLSSVRGLNKLALMYVLYKFFRYETNALSHIYSNDQTREILEAQGLASASGALDQDYLDTISLHDMLTPLETETGLEGVPAGYEDLARHGSEVITPVGDDSVGSMVPENLGPMGHALTPPPAYADLTSHGTQVIVPPDQVSRSAEAGFQVMSGDNSGFLTFSTYGNAFWALYLLLITHFGVKWLRTVAGVPSNTYLPYEEEVEVASIAPAQNPQNPPDGGQPQGNQPRREPAYNYGQLEEVLRVKGVIDQAVEDTPSVSDGFQETRVAYGNTSSATDWKLIMEASKLLARGDTKSRILGKAILRKVQRESQDAIARHDARIMIHQSEKVYPEIMRCPELLQEARDIARNLSTSQNFFADLLYLEGFQEELRKPMAIWWHKLFKLGETNDFTRSQAKSLRKAASTLAILVSDGIQAKVESLVSDENMDKGKKLRMLRDILYRLRHSFSIGRFILRKLPRERRILNMTYRRPLNLLKKEIWGIINSMRLEVEGSRDDNTKLEKLAEIYKAQAIFNFKGIRSWWNIFASLNILNPFWHTQNYRRKASILKEINNILNPLRVRKEQLERKKEVSHLDDIEEGKLKRINSILAKYNEFDIYDELMALQKDYINMLRLFVISRSRKKNEQRKFSEDGEVVRNSQEHIRDIHNAFKRLLGAYKKFKTASYQFYLRSPDDLLADVGMKSRWTVGNYANYSLRQIQRKRENTSDVVSRIADVFERLGLNQIAQNIRTEIANINNNGLSEIERIQALERAITIISQEADNLLTAGRLDEAHDVLRELAKISHPQITGHDIFKKANDLFKSAKPKRDDLRTKIERHLQSNPFTAELGIIADMTKEETFGPSKRMLMPRFKIDKSYIREVLDNPNGKYNLEERRQLLQAMLMGYYPLGRRNLQREMIRALVGIYNMKLVAAQGNKDEEGNVKKEIEAFEGIFYEFYVYVNKYAVRDRGRFTDNTGAYKFFWDLTVVKKEKYIRRHGKSIKKAINAAVLNPISYLTGYNLDIRFSPIERVVSSPNDLHGKVDKVSNSMSWLERSMYRACAKAKDELLGDLGYYSLDFSKK